MKQAIDLLSALAEPTRLAALRLLWDGREHCVCEMMDRLGATQSRMSRHMGVLEKAGLVVGRRDRQWVRYTRSARMRPEVVAVVEAALAVAEAVDDPRETRASGASEVAA